MGAGFDGGQGLRFTIEVEDRGSTALRTFNAQLERTEKLATTAVGGFTRMEARIVTLAGGLELAARAMNVAARAFDQLIGQVVRRGEELQTLSRRLSINVETLSRFDFAAKQAGVNLEGLGQGFRKLAASLVEAEQKGTAANKILVQGLGFTVQQLKSLQGDPKAALLAIGDAFNRYGDSARKTVAAQQIFGRGFQDVLVLLKEGRAEIEKNIALSERLGLVWTTGQAAAADQLGDSVTALVAAFGAFGTEIVKNEDFLTQLASVVDETTDRLIAFRESLTPEQLSAINDGILAMTRLMGGLAEAVLTVGSRAAQAFGSIASLIGSASTIHQVSAENASAQAILETRLRERGVPFTRQGGRFLFDAPGGFSAAPGPEASFATPDQLAAIASFVPPAAPRTGDFPFTPGGSQGGGGAEAAARSAEHLRERLAQLRLEIEAFADPAKALDADVNQLATELENLATKAKLPTTGLRDLAAEYVKAKDAAKKLEEEQKAQQRRMEEGAKLARTLADRLEALQDPAAAASQEFEKLAEEALKAGRADLLPLIRQIQTVEEQMTALESIFTPLQGLIQDTFEGLVLGTRQSGDALKALKEILLREVVTALLAVAKAAALAQITGGSFSTQLAGTTKGTLFGGLISVGSSLVGGGNGGGLLSGLLSGGGGGGTGVPSTFGIPSLAQQLLGAGLSGATVGAAAAPGAFSSTAGLGFTFAGAQPLPAGATFTPNAVGGGASSLSAITAGIGALIALGLAAKGLIDTRSGIDRVTLGTGNRTSNTLTGLGAGIIAGTTLGGAGIGLAAGGPIGAVVGAGVGAATGAAIEQAIAKGVTKGISDSVRQGLTQRQLEQTIAKETGDDLILNILTGYLNKYGGIADTLGPLVAPDIERIFAKVFREVIGGAGGLDTAGITGASTYGLRENVPQAAQAARIIAQAFGAGGEAFGDEREGNFVRILLGGVKKRINKEGGEAGQIIAETFAAAFNGKFLNALAAIFTERKGLRDGDLRFAAEQFAKGSPAFGFNYQRVVDAAIEGGRVPGKPARRRSREVFGEAFQAAVQNPDDPLAFQRAAQAGFVSTAAEGFTKAIASSSLGIGFADIFAPDKEERRALRRARRTGGAAAAAGTLIQQFEDNIGEFVAAVNDPAYAKAVKTFTDGVFKMGVTVSIAASDIDGARALIEQRLGGSAQAVRDVQQLRRDVRSRTAFLVSGPGFAQAETAIGDLFDQRREAERRLQRRPGVVGGRTFLDSLAGTVGFTRDADLPKLLAEVQDFAQLRLAELEAETALAREMRDYYRDIRRSFEATREAIDVTRRGPRALQDILTKRQDEVSRLLPTALGAASEDQRNAVARINELLPEILNLGSQLFAPGSASFDALLTFADRTAEKLINSATAEEKAAAARLDAAQKNAEEFRTAILPVLGLIELRTQQALETKLADIALLLDGNTGALAVLREIRDGFENLGLKKRQHGGPVVGGQAYLVGEDGPEVFVPNRGGTVLANGSATAQVSLGGIHVTVARDVTEADIVDAVTRAVRAKAPQLVREIQRAVA